MYLISFITDERKKKHVFHIQVKKDGMGNFHVLCSELTSNLFSDQYSNGDGICRYCPFGYYSAGDRASIDDCTGENLHLQIDIQVVNHIIIKILQNNIRPLQI